MKKKIVHLVHNHANNYFVYKFNQIDTNLRRQNIQTKQNILNKIGLATKISSNLKIKKRRCNT